MLTPHIDSIEHWSLDRPVPYTENARIHSEQQISQIAGSIEVFGFVNPILVGDDQAIVAGHDRLLASGSMQWLNGWLKNQRKGQAKERTYMDAFEVSTG